MSKTAEFFHFAQMKLNTADVGLSKAVSVNNNTLQTTLSLAYFAAGVVCVVMIIIGGIRYTTSQGDSGGLTSAKNTILYAVIGLVVILLAAAITQLIFDKL